MPSRHRGRSARRAPDVKSLRDNVVITLASARRTGLSSPERVRRPFFAAHRGGEILAAWVETL